jgi:PAS domain S-box-containing protein
LSEASGDLEAPRWEPSAEVRALLEHAPITILVRDVDGNYLFANEQARQRIARSAGEVTSTSVFDVFPEAIADRLLEQDREVVKSGTDTVVETDLPMPDGSTRSYLLAKYPVVPRPGLPTLAATVATDITDQQVLAAALHESELRFRQLTDSIEDVFSLNSVNPAEMLYVSPSAAEVYGVPLAEGEADPTAYLRNVDADDFKVVMAMLNDVSRRQKGGEVEFRVHHPTRGLRWMRARARPVTGPGGELRIAMVVNDVTDDRQLEEELVRARDVAEEANARKNEFLSQMSHELRTPLNAILGFSQLLELDERRLDADQVDHVRQIRRAGQHLLDLINDILDMTRIERGVVTLTPEPLEIGPIARQVGQLLEIQAQVRSITIDVSNAGGDAVVVADRQRLTQVLINLVGNAVKYNRVGGRVDLSWRRVDDRVHIGVADTGAGMSAPDLERLFTPFERLGRAETIEGTGIGLALSRQLVHAMGGTITVDSAVGVGTTFVVSLPVSGPG